MRSEIGSPTIIKHPYVVINTLNIPDFVVYPSQLPSTCYKWKVVISTPKGSRYHCSTSTPWYDAPIH